MKEQDVVLPNGTHIEGYITWEERQYALVVAVTEKGIPLVRQYKHGLQLFSLDFPGGYLNTNEEPFVCAKRELLEETGFAADHWTHLSSLVYLNTDEEPFVCAKRELLEETGFAADHWTHLSSLVLDNNRGHAKAHLFLAEGVHSACLPHLDDTEDLTIEFYTWHQLTNMVNQGHVTSLPTVAALYMALHHLNIDKKN